MSAWKQDSFGALLASAFVTVLLFFAREAVNQRDLSHSTPAPQQTVEPLPETVDRSDDAPADRSAEEKYRVIAIIDGDTAEVLVDRKPQRLRFAGIDTPEKGQPFGNTAKTALSKRIGGKTVRVVVRETDRYGRSIADLYDEQGHVNLWLVQQGLAWHYTAFSNDASLAAAENEARLEKRGLWSDPRSVAPWNWRKLSAVERDQYR